MKKKEYLNEENYQKSKQKLIKLALIILIVGLLIGGSLIITGIVKTNNANNENNLITNQEKIRTEAEIQSDIDYTQMQINTIDNEINNIDAEINKIQKELSQIFLDDKGYSDRYYAKEDEITAKQNEKTNKINEKYNLNKKMMTYESELWDVQNNNNSNLNNEVGSIFNTAKYMPFYIFGGFIIFVSCIFSGTLYMIAKRRDIMAFTAQQVMPLAQEGMEKMAPTIGKTGATIAEKMAPAYGDIAKEISKGIKEGTKDSENNK